VKSAARLSLFAALALTACHGEAVPAPSSTRASSTNAASPLPEGLVTHEVGSTGQVVILLHGYGAQGDDLVPLARQLGAAHFYFPEAPILMPTGGRRWFGRQSEGATAGEVDEARNGVIALIEKLESEGTPASEIILGGFSQGAMLTVDVAQHLAALGKQLGGLIVLSGSTMPHWPANLDVRTNVLITHGQTDRVLAITQAEQLQQRLIASGSDVEFVPFPGGHAIPPIVQSATADFIHRED
jgi:phospholipase/carboxylesterase